MGRVTRNSNGTTRAPPPGTYQANGAGGRKTLIKGNGKKVQEVKNDLSGDGRGKEDKETHTQTTVFDFPAEVSFEYTPRQSGFGTVLEIMKNGNESVKEKVLNECNLIFECRCCNNLFRSPRDFLTHKDKHCTEKYEKVSPAGLSELLRLAQNSFKINQEIPPNNQTVTTLPPVSTSLGSAVGDDLGDLSFDVNHLVPILTTSFHPPSAGDQKPKIQKGLEPRELELLTDTVGQRASGVLQTMRQLPREVNGDVKLLGKYKSMKSEQESALIGADGKTAVMGKSNDIQLIVDKLTAQWESKREEQEVMESNLTCSTCQMLCGSVKELRIHSRQEHRQVKSEKRKKTGEGGINGITKETNLGDESHKSLPPKVKATSHKKRLTNPRPVPVPPEAKVTPEPSTSKSYVKLLSKDPKSPPRVSSFRRLTNNSFSSSLTLSPEGSNILPLGPEPPLKMSKLVMKSKGSSKGVQEASIPVPGEDPEVDYKAMAKALFPTERRRSVRRNAKVKKASITPKVRPSLSPKKISCLKCTAEFGEELEMSVHLGNCIDTQNSGNRIGIIHRHDYIKPSPLAPTSSSSSGEEEGGAPQDQKVKESTPVPFNNNENEVGGERGIKKFKSFKGTSQVPSSSPSPSEPEVIPLPSPVTPSRMTKMPELIPANRA